MGKKNLIATQRIKWVSVLESNKKYVGYSKKKEIILKITDNQTTLTLATILTIRHS